MDGGASGPCKRCNDWRRRRLRLSCWHNSTCAVMDATEGLGMAIPPPPRSASPMETLPSDEYSFYYNGRSPAAFSSTLGRDISSPSRCTATRPITRTPSRSGWSSRRLGKRTARSIGNIARGRLRAFVLHIRNAVSITIHKRRIAGENDFGAECR